MLLDDLRTSKCPWLHQSTFLLPLGRSEDCNLTHQWIASRGFVVLGNGVIDVHDETRVVGAICARERHQVRLVRACAAADTELGARDVQLSAADATSAVKSNVFDAEEVLAICEAPGNLDVKRRFAWGINVNTRERGTTRDEGACLKWARSVR